MTPRRGEPVALDWLPAGAALASVAACYGTTLTIAALSALGVAVALDQAAWASLVGFPALAAVTGIVLGRRRHGAFAPILPALAGAAAIFWALFAHYHWMVELAGFVALVLAALWDRRLKRSLRERPDRAQQ